LNAGLPIALDVIVVVATVATVLAAPRALALTGQNRPSAVVSCETHRLPGLWLCAVIAAIYVNQLLFTVYVIRVHGGDPSFIARYLPAGWFALATDSVPVRSFARLFPAPDLLAVTVLRVQAFLELPLVLLAYLTACRWLDPLLYQRLVSSPLLWLASAADAATFCLIELSLPNPYTGQDLVIRTVSAVMAPAAIRWLGATGSAGAGRVRSARPANPPQAVRGTLSLLAFLASAAALGYVVLAVYDTALLYNLGHTGRWLPGVGLALVVLAVARLVARRTANDAPRPGIDVITSSLWWWLGLFFVPALSIRYALGFGAAPIARPAVVALALVAGALGVRDALRQHAWRGRGPVPLGAWALEMVAALLLSVAAGWLAWRRGAGSVEEALLRAAVLASVTSIAVCALLDHLMHRAGAQAVRTDRDGS
jgi:hypothetical protein